MKQSTTMTTAALLTGMALFVTACAGGVGGSDGKKDHKKESANSAGASGGGKDGGNGGADADKALKTRKCLRDNGIDAPDPKPGEDPRGMTLGAGSDPEATKKAFEKCGLQAPGSGGEVPQATKDQALKTAKCMRDHGFDMKDPEFNGNAMTGTSIPDGADKDAFMAQLNKCSAAT
ncbi:hypothetical protein OHS33_20790 [Streptomyces sp. NBC_00536]|uniref:hypothetical protein n=1 Tax=Streptomyces sp. NBC_00536 TaxID=2975769 RepID=UPI002E7FBA19|nr:hypothetical protein [Streptomyces sp. NBC_00536]WUC80541.1 hypothetical protein OHS33_20790 [Streptomyces sp. NBC_00536]